MILGVLSDTHNNHENLRRALDVFRREGVTTLIHCGDMTSPETAALLAGFEVKHVSGNMANAPGALRRALLALNPDNFSGISYSGQIDGVWVAATHGHLSGTIDKFLRDGRYAYVFHGHTHRRRDEKVAGMRFINPGALGGAWHEERSICVVDLDEGEVRFIEIAER
jgi:putative phosphoesterase